MWRSLVLIPLFGTFASSLWAAPKTWVELYDFSATGRFHVARKTSLKRVTAGPWIVDPVGNIRTHRYIMQNSRLDIGFRLEVVNKEALSVETLYQELQSFALKEMLERGYISPSLFEDVSQALHIWKPPQIRFALDLTEMSEAEALQRYDGNIPWHRVMGGKEFHPKGPLTFVRASIMMGLGQATNLRNGAMHTLPLSWEHYPEPHPLAFPAGSTPPPMVEFSRALAGDSVIGGSLSELVRISLYWLEAEARLRQTPLDQYLLFAHGLDKKHARYFRQAFRMKQFTAEAQQAILESRLNFGALPKGSPEGDRSVAFTPLAEAVKIPGLSPTGLSLTRSWRAGVSGSEERAHAFEREFYRGVYWHMWFDDSVQKMPVCIQDGSAVATLPALEEVYRWQKEGDFGKLFTRAGKMKWDPNFWAPYWNGAPFILPEITTAEGVRPLGFVRIDNLTDAGEAYLRDILMQTYGAQWHRVRGASLDARRIMVNYLHQLESTLPPVPGTSSVRLSADPSNEEILDRFVYVIFTDQTAVRDLAVKMGGKAFRGNSLTVPKIWVRVDADGVKVLRSEIAGEGWGVVFRAPQIRALLESKPAPIATCSQHLLDYFLLQAAAQM